MKVGIGICFLELKYEKIPMHLCRGFFMDGKKLVFRIAPEDTINIKFESEDKCKTAFNILESEFCTNLFKLVSNV